MKRGILRSMLLGVLIFIVSLVALFGLVAFIKKRPVKHPLTLRFVGWTNQGPTPMARLVISNASDYPLPFAADSQSQPRIDVLQIISREQRGVVQHYVVSNLTSQFYVGFRPVSLPPGAAVLTAFPWQHDYTNAAVMLGYLPKRTAVGDFFRKVRALLADQPVESWDAAPLQAPWVTERQRRGSPRLGTNDNL